MPFWATLRHVAWFKAVLVGLNNTAMGFIFAACVLMWEQAIGNAAAAATFCVTGVLASNKVAAPLCILAGGCVGAVLNLVKLGQVAY
jgi:chromate transport protein ChrA